MTECSIDGCAKRMHAHKLCPMHLERFKKHGDPLFVNTVTGRPLKGDVPSFAAIHKRLARKRGPARNFDCVDCGGRAAEWSYRGGCPGELKGLVRGSVVPYSTDLDRYVPRCVRCHRIFDKAGEGRTRDEGGRFVSVVNPVGVRVLVMEAGDEHG